MTLLFRMDDRMNRQLSSTITQADRALALAEELVHYGFINEVDREQIGALMNDALRNCMARNEQVSSSQANANANVANTVEPSHLSQQKASPTSPTCPVSPSPSPVSVS